jgi:hypothetical protein
MRELLHQWRRIMQHSSVQPLKLPHDSRRNNGPPPTPPHDNRRNNGLLPKPPHDSKPSLPSKPSNAPPLTPPHGSRPLNRPNNARRQKWRHDGSTGKPAGIQGSHLVRSEGYRTRLSLDSRG